MTGTIPEARSKRMAQVSNFGRARLVETRTALTPADRANRMARTQSTGYVQAMTTRQPTFPSSESGNALAELKGDQETCPRGSKPSLRFDRTTT